MLLGTGALAGLCAGGVMLWEARGASEEGSTLPREPVSSLQRKEPEEPKLYQLLYDYQLHEPLSSVGQKVRILVWLRYMQLSTSQKQVLLSLARRYRERVAAGNQKVDELVRHYEAELEPHYQALYQALSAPTVSEENLDQLARQLQGVNLAFRREEELHSLRVGEVRRTLSEEEELLRTLSPEQEEKLLTSLFFLRQQLDPFANPGTYRAVIGPTWNAGDFTPLLRQKKPQESNLNIGGLWGLSQDGQELSNFPDVQRPIVLFFVLKEPALIPTLEEVLATRTAASPEPPAVQKP